MPINRVRLTQDERNQLFQRIVAIGLQPSDFAWSETDAYVELTHKPTDYSFRFSSGHDQTYKVSYWAEYSPPMRNKAASRVDSRSARLELAFDWLNVVKREHDLARPVGDGDAGGGGDRRRSRR